MAQRLRVTIRLTTRNRYHSKRTLHSVGTPFHLCVPLCERRNTERANRIRCAEPQCRRPLPSTLSQYASSLLCSPPSRLLDQPSRPSFPAELSSRQHVLLRNRLSSF